MRKIWLLLLISIAGCITTRERVLRIELVQPPELLDKVLYVATNQPVAVAIQGEDQVLNLNVGGYYLMSRMELELLLKSSQKYLRIKDTHSFSEVQRIVNE